MRQQRSSFHNMPLAVIGMACRLPGADDLDAYWDLIEQSRDAIIELPANRLDPELYYHPEKGRTGTSYTRLGGVVPERPFDESVCRIPEGLAEETEAVYLTMLEVAARACRHAGYDPNDLLSRNMGVFIGHSRGGLLASELTCSIHAEETAGCLHNLEAFAGLSSNLQQQVLDSFTERLGGGDSCRDRLGEMKIHTHEVAGIIAEVLGLEGPYMAVDAACASSIYALSVAARELHHGNIDMAIVGGASYSNWQAAVMFSQAMALGTTGSFPFDDRADGFISSDGYAAILTKTLSRAIHDNDRILGVIRGIGLSTDGKGRSLWAPRKEGQMEAIRRAYVYGLDKSRLQYVEAHATSTSLGDMTEISALTSAVKDDMVPGTRIPLTSVKANIGHTLETAGMAGLVKTLLAIQNKIIPPAANYSFPNSRIDWEHVPFFVPTEPLKWHNPEDGHPRCAAVNSFGIGGLNSHVVLEEYVPASSTLVSLSKLPTGSVEAETHATDLNDAVAILGLGAIFPGARTLNAFWDLIVSGQDTRQLPPSGHWLPDLFKKDGVDPTEQRFAPRGGFIDDFVYDWRMHKIPPQQIEYADPLQFMILDAADQALQDAGYEDKAFDRQRTGVVIGTLFMGDFSINLNLALNAPAFCRDLRRALVENGIEESQSEDIVKAFSVYFDTHKPMLRDETGSYSASTLASRITKTLDLMGGAFSLDSGESSALAALRAAHQLLLSDTCNMVLCGAGQRAMDLLVYERIKSTGRLAREKSGVAFETDAKGYVPGEGVGMLVLKRLKDAKRDGDPVRAIIRSIGSKTVIDQPGKALAGAITSALDHAGVASSDVVAVETVGLGEPLTDTQELNAIVSTYEQGKRSSPLWLASLVGQIGHTLGASGMASLIKMSLTLQNRRLPANIRQKNPVSLIADSDAAVRLVSEEVNLDPDAGRKQLLAGINALSFRGQAYHVLLESGDSVPDTRVNSPGEWRIIRIGASSFTELNKRLAGSFDDASSLYVSAPLSRFTPHDTVRLAIVAQGEDDLAKKLRLANGQVASMSGRFVLEEQGIFCRVSDGSVPRLAVLYPGQGAQYVGMLREFAQSIPAAATKHSEINDLMLRMGLPTFDQLAWSETNALGRDVWSTQASVLLADMIVWAALVDLGIRPDVISSHSYGEFPALVAAGALTLEQAVHVTKKRCEFIETDKTTAGLMLATTAPYELVQDSVRRLDETIWIANHNAPDQTVVGGIESAVLLIKTQLDDQGFENSIVPVPRPFHTPLMTPVQKPLSEVLNKIRFRPPEIPMLSSVTNRYVAEPQDIKNNLVRQLIEPVRYVAQVQRLVEDGISVFVEVGPGQLLTRLNKRILAGQDVSVIACDNRKRSGVGQFLRVKALLECTGILEENEYKVNSRGTAALAAGTGHGDGEIVHFDATLRRQQKMRRSARHGPGVHDRRVTRDRTDDPISSFLVQFVCEHTGYPPEIVDMDADLEADLGIDSVKKAQLLGELRELFGFKVDMNTMVSLDTFTTLGHIRGFMIEAGVTHKEGQIVRVAGADTTRKTSHHDSVSIGRSDPHESPGPAELIFVRCAGSPFSMGLQQGREQAHEIKGLLARLKHLNHGQQDDNSLEVYKHKIGEQTDFLFDHAALEEMKGFTEGAGVSFSDLVAYNLLGYLADLDSALPAGCSHFAVTAGHNGSTGFVHGVNEDVPLALRFPEGQVRIVQVRHPENGIQHLFPSFLAKVGGLNGINASGLSVSSTMLLDRNRPKPDDSGIIHAVLVRSILESAEDIESAIDIVRNTERIGAWSLCLCHAPSDRICYLEYDGSSLETRDFDNVFLSTNHSLLFESDFDVEEHSQYRLTRLTNLLKQENGKTGVTPEMARLVLRDRYDLARGREVKHPTMNTVCRVDNQNSLVMSPADGIAWITPGPLVSSKIDHFVTLDLENLISIKSHTGHVRSTSYGDTYDAASVKEVDESESTPGMMMDRFVMRMINAPLNEPVADVHFEGASLIVGENSSALVLRDRIEACGVPVFLLPATDDPIDAVKQIEYYWKKESIRHLFLMTARDEEALCRPHERDWATRRRKGVLLPYIVCQRWIQLKISENHQGKATLVAVTAMGGDFGFSGKVKAAEGGALTGLLKSIRKEFEELYVKVVDTLPEASPDSVVDAVLKELAARRYEVEVGYQYNSRSIVHTIPRAISLSHREPFPVGSTWVVTGGARGISAYVARELGQRYGLVMHLIGKSNAPSPEAVWRGLSESELKDFKNEYLRTAYQSGQDSQASWREVEKEMEIARTLAQFEEDGTQVTYYACDVSDRGALAAVVEDIRRTAGPIHGIIHGAGIEAAARFERKNLTSVESTIAAKVDGAAALMALTRDNPPAYFIGFGSISGRFGTHGQTDYALASDMLAKLTQQYRKDIPGCASVVFHWPGWDEVGMSMRPEGRLALESAQMSFLPPQEGLKHLIDELHSGAHEGEVLILDRPGTLDKDGSMPETATRKAYSRRHGLVEEAPLIEGVFDLREEHGLTAEMQLDPVEDPFLREHLFQGIPLMPAVIGLESFVEAVHVLVPEAAVAGLEDICIINGLRFRDDQKQRSLIHVSLDGNGAHCKLTGAFYDTIGRLVDPARVYLKATVRLSDDSSVLTEHKPEIPDSWKEVVYQEKEQALEKGSVYLGPAIRVLQMESKPSPPEWGVMVEPDFVSFAGSRKGEWNIPVALLDGCLVACVGYALNVFDINTIPQGIKSLLLGRLPALNERCLVHIRFKERKESYLWFDFTLFGNNDDIILSGEGLRLFMPSSA